MFQLLEVLLQPLQKWPTDIMSCVCLNAWIQAYYHLSYPHQAVMTEQSSSARVGRGIAAGQSVSEKDGAADSPYAAVLDWDQTHNRVLNLDSLVGPVEPGAGRRWTGTLLPTLCVNWPLGPPGGGRLPAWTRG
jgi:hypothetical protein